MPRSTEISPLSAKSWPRMIEKSVVLPAPFGPTSPMRSCRFTCNVASANNTRSPYALRMPDKVNMSRRVYCPSLSIILATRSRWARSRRGSVVKWRVSWEISAGTRSKPAASRDEVAPSSLKRGSFPRPAGAAKGTRNPPSRRAGSPSGTGDRGGSRQGASLVAALAGRIEEAAVAVAPIADVARLEVVTGDVAHRVVPGVLDLGRREGAAAGPIGRRPE